MAIEVRNSKLRNGHPVIRIYVSGGWVAASWRGEEPNTFYFYNRGITRAEARDLAKLLLEFADTGTITPPKESKQ